MTHTITFDEFDTFKQAEHLKEAGFNDIQIKAQIENTKEQVTYNKESVDNNLATKYDLYIGLKELELTIEKSKNQTIAWMSGIVTLATAILGILITYHK
jgi:hypothetical protein